MPDKELLNEIRNIFREEVKQEVRQAIKQEVYPLFKQLNEKIDKVKIELEKRLETETNALYNLITDVEKRLSLRIGRLEVKTDRLESILAKLDNKVDTFMDFRKSIEFRVSTLEGRFAASA